MRSPRSVMVLGVAMCLAMIVALIAEIAAGAEGSGRQFIGTTWGRLTLLDLYLGLLVVGVWMWHREAGVVRRMAWLVAFLILGNLGVGAYLVRAGRSASWNEFFRG